MKPSASLCVQCKGTKKLCGMDFCPILKRIDAQVGFKTKVSQDVFGPSQELFVGSYGYPTVSFGPLATIDREPVSVKNLYGRPYEEIIDIRTSMVRGNKFSSVTNRMNLEMQEVALSTKVIDVEMKLSKKPAGNTSFSTLVQPMGPSAPLLQFKQADNPKIPKRVDTVISEGLLATDALAELSGHGFDNYYLTNIFSTGAFGKIENRRMVPTRWSITAMDDILGKQMMERVRDYPPTNNIVVYSNEYLYNHFEVLLIPGSWEFENFEAWSPNSVWAGGAAEAVVTEEYEPFWGRTKYADKQVGGYYASRFSVLKHLDSIRRQARVVVFREIGSEYMVPVGVFAVRETVKKSFDNIGFKFQKLNDALEYISTKLKVPITRYLLQSQVLKQTRLLDF